MTNKNLLKLREKANFELLNLLCSIMVANPQLRFTQILIDYEFITDQDEYYLEPIRVLNRVKNTCKRFKKEQNEKEN